MNLLLGNGMQILHTLVVLQHDVFFLKWSDGKGGWVFDEVHQSCDWMAVSVSLMYIFNMNGPNEICADLGGNR